MTLYDFFSMKNDVNVALKSNKQKVLVPDPYKNVTDPQRGRAVYKNRIHHDDHVTKNPLRGGTNLQHPPLSCNAFGKINSTRSLLLRNKEEN